MKKVLIFPSWLLIRLFIPFLPKQHDWYGRKFTLKNWAAHSTQLNFAFSAFFWSAGIFICFVIWFKFIR